MANPKRKTSKARKRKRRSHLALGEPMTSVCPRCHQMKQPHRICWNCGYYRDRVVIQP